MDTTKTGKSQADREFSGKKKISSAEADCKSSPLFGVSTCILEILSVCGIIILIDYAKRKKYHKKSNHKIALLNSWPIVENNFYINTI